MSDPIPFQSKIQLTNHQQLAAFIHQAEHISNVWNGHPGFLWSDNIWKTPRGALRFVKYGIDLHTRQIPTPDQQFEPGYMEFAKAYIINSRNNDHAKIFRAEYRVLQILHTALIAVDGYADITRLSNVHLDKAVEIILKRKTNHAEYGWKLQSLARLVGTHNISPHSLKYWCSSIPKDSAGAESTKQALPDEEAMLALAEIFSRGYHSELDDEAVYVTSITAILLSAPMRISEKLRLRPESLKSEKDKDGVTQWYLHYYSTKNKKMVTKGITKTMAGHCREAFKRLEAVTQPGRNLALYLESNNTAFYPHPRLPDVPADQILSRDEVCAALARASPTATESLMKLMVGHYRLEGWTLDTLWKVVRDYNLKINPFFPYQVDPNLYKVKPPKMSESLLCFLRLQLSQGLSRNPLLLAPINQYFYAMRVGPDLVASSNGKTYESFLTRHGYPGLTIRSHQLRHFLNTAAKEAGTAIEVITQWSGRASVRQTRDYIHQDPVHKARKYGSQIIPVADVTPEPITAAEYDLRNKGPIITSRYGICMHPWTTSPCQKSGDCLNCSELLHCKGHKNSLAAVKVERGQVAENLAATVKEIEAGNRPATRWVDTHTRYLERLNQIVAMHENPDIPDGSPVQMIGKDFTHAQRILINKHPQAALPNNTSSVISDIGDTDLLACFSEMMGDN
jgi:hypothetical protein